ncbi:MAG: hypothetical protein KAT71_04865, partial [Gammaproteobacteria bacterium]|nr:hypothetical protein [Gammaproteobacteria bacterium]
VAEAIEKRDQGALKSALAAASKALSSPGTYGCVGALGNAIGFPGAAQMFLIAFTMGTAANTKALYDSIGNSAVSKEQKVKFLFDAAINGLQAIGCVFGLDAIGMGDTNPAANPDANTQQWLMTACSAGALAGALWEVGEAVKPTVDAMRNLGVFGKPKAGQANAPTETTNLLAGAPAPTQEV